MPCWFVCFFFYNIFNAFWTKFLVAFCFNNKFMWNFFADAFFSCNFMLVFVSFLVNFILPQFNFNIICIILKVLILFVNRKFNKFSLNNKMFLFFCVFFCVFLKKQTKFVVFQMNECAQSVRHTHREKRARLFQWKRTMRRDQNEIWSIYEKKAKKTPLAEFTHDFWYLVGWLIA